MPARFLVVWFVFAIVFSVQITGCSLIGFGVGSAIDRARPVRLRPGDPPRIVTLEPGAKLVLRMIDGTAVAGTYRGLVAEPEAEYSRRYAAWLDTADLGFRPPRIGEFIRIRSISGARLSHHPTGIFLGFGPRRVHWRDVKAEDGEVLAFNRLSWIADSAGRRIDRDALERMADALPVQALARIEQGATEQRVDLLDGTIATVEFGGPNHGFRTAGLIIGLTADAAIIAVAGALASDPGPSCEPTYTGGSFAHWHRLPASPPLDSIYVLPAARLALGP